MRYDVHIFAVIRIKVSNVEADGQEAAIRQAVRATDLHGLFDRADAQYAEENVRYLVDEIGDTEYTRTQTYLDLPHLQLNSMELEQGAAVLDTSEG